jgi:hypothetical protein
MTISLSQECPLTERPAVPLWSENFALLAGDPAQRLSVMYSIGTWFRDPSVWRENLAVVWPDGQVFTTRNFGRNTLGKVVSAALSRYEIIEQDRRVRLGYDGPVWGHSFAELMREGQHSGKTSRLVLDVRFNACAPTWDMHAGHEHDPTGIAGAMHIEQLGEIEGSVRLDDRELKLANVPACRDHSRGKREVTNYRNHCWINGRFPSGRAFQLYYFRMHGVDGAALSVATIVHQNRHVPATIEHIEIADDVADAGRTHALRLRSALGEMNVAIAEVLTTIPVQMSAPFNPAFGSGRGSYAQMFDEAVRLECDGETGYGWCERGFSKQPLR